MGLSWADWLRNFYSSFRTKQHFNSEDINQNLAIARDACFRVMTPHINTLGCIQLPHPGSK